MQRLFLICFCCNKAWGTKKLLFLLLILMFQYYYYSIYYNQFLPMDVQKHWIKYSSGDKSCYILIHTLAQKLWEDICNIILKIHLLTGCDATRKVVIKVAAVKSNYHYQPVLGKIEGQSFQHLGEMKNTIFYQNAIVYSL